MRSISWLMAVCLCVSLTAAQRPTDTAACRPVGKPRLLPRVPEASGIALSTRGDALWTINDSGKPVLFRLDGDREPAPVAISGADVRDWEDIAVGKCPAGTCLYIADIGDNRGSRRQIVIYRMPEPRGAASSAAAEVFRAEYPDGPHDAEALLVTPQQQLFIITKEVPPRVYRFPAPLNAASTVRLELVRSLGERVRITGAAASPDGQWIALRSKATLLLYRAADFASGAAPTRIDLSGLHEPQGEGVAFGPAGELYLVSEAGRDGAAGMLTRLNCTLPR